MSGKWSVRTSKLAHTQTHVHAVLLMWSFLRLVPARYQHEQLVQALLNISMCNLLLGIYYKQV